MLIADGNRGMRRRAFGESEVSGPGVGEAQLGGGEGTVGGEPAAPSDATTSEAYRSRYWERPKPKYEAPETLAGYKEPGGAREEIIDRLKGRPGAGSLGGGPVGGGPVVTGPPLSEMLPPGGIVGGQLPSGEAAPVEMEPYQQPDELSDITKRLLGISAEDVGYLRGEPYSTTQEQAMRAREQDRIRNEFDTARQRMIDTLGPQQGFSGVLAGALEKLSQGEASEMSKVDRDIMIRAADEMRSRRGESRGVVGGLEELERRRMMESLGLGQAIDQGERQGLLDLMAALGLAPGYGQMGQGTPSILEALSQQGQTAAQQGAANLTGISSLAKLFYDMGWMK